MSDPFVGEIRLFSFQRIPLGWLACDGSQQPIANYEVLYTLLGTVFGGDGVNTFNVPDLRGRVPLSRGSGRGLTPRALGQISGTPTHTLSMSEMPFHGHALMASTKTGETAIPGPGVQLATASLTTDSLYTAPASIPNYVVMGASIVASGRSQAHDNMMPTLTANYCICFAGIFPPQS
jgi:microcystin-dependent protein